MLTSLLNLLVGQDDPEDKSTIYEVKEPEPVRIIIDSPSRLSERERQLSKLRNKEGIRYISDKGLKNLTYDIEQIYNDPYHEIFREFNRNNNQDMTDLNLYILECKSRMLGYSPDVFGDIVRLTIYP